MLVPMSTDDTGLPTSWNDDSSGGKGSKKWWVIGGVLLVLIVAGVVALVVARKDVNRVYEVSSTGRAPGLGQTGTKAPDVDVTAEPGVYFWQDFDGVHVWVVNGGDINGVKGTITADADIDSATLAIPATGTAKVDGKTITFDFPASPQLLGVDFNPGFYTKEITVDVTGPDGKSIDPKLVHKGANAKVTKLPVVIRKVPEGEAANS